MNKRSITFLLFILLFTVQLHAAALSSGDYSYTILADGTAEITAYQGTDITVTIPHEIGDAAVTSIGAGAFSYNETAAKIIVPEGVISIGDHAFGECTKLKSVELPSSLSWLGDLVFQGDVRLTKAALPDSLVHIGINPFDRCDVLDAVELREDHPFYTVEKGILYDRRAGKMISYPAGVQETSYTVPDWVTSIGMAAFSENAMIREVVLPDTLIELEGNPFCGCTALTGISVSPDHLVFKIKDGTLFNKQTGELVAYLWGSDETGYTVPEGTPAIGQEAFYKHGELKYINIPGSVTEIGSGAFAQTGLSMIRIPEGVRVLNDSLFSECAELISVILPDGITAIGSSVFYACPRLRSVNLPESLRSIGYAAFVRCDSLRGVSIPEGLQVIGDYAYAGCGQLMTVSVPESVTFIGDNSFYSDPYLTLLVAGNSYARTWAEENNVRYRLEEINYLDSEII